MSAISPFDNYRAETHDFCRGSEDHNGTVVSIADEKPARVRETVRLGERDVKNSYDELISLEALRIIRFEQAGRSTRPIVPYEDVIIIIPF